MYNRASSLLRVRAHRFESMAMASSSSDARQPTRPSTVATEKRKARFQRSGICGPHCYDHPPLASHLYVFDAQRAVADEYCSILH